MIQLFWYFTILEQHGEISQLIDKHGEIYQLIDKHGEISQLIELINMVKYLE